MTPREEAQIEAEKTFDLFIVWGKRVVMWSVFILLVVVVGCNSGVDNKTGSQYNGEQYDPQNLKVK